MIGPLLWSGNHVGKFVVAPLQYSTSPRVLWERSVSDSAPIKPKARGRVFVPTVDDDGPLEAVRWCYWFVST